MLGRRARVSWLVAGIACLAACAQVPAAVETDAASADASVADAGPPPPPWPHDLVASTSLGDRRGLRVARAIVHLHSPLSHDACDGEGWVDGALADAPCLAHLRAAACTLRMDALMLTDHAPHLEEVDVERALWIAEGDEAVMGTDGSVVAARWACPDGHRVLVTMGSENALMPVGLARHPLDRADPVALAELYDSDGAAAADAFRAAGAVVFYAHTEEKSLDQIRATRPDGIEIYNTHANVDPNIREMHLGLGRLDYAPTLLRFTSASSGLEPDLAFLSFYSANDNALAKWDTLLAEGMRLSGIGGCDAHENTFPTLLPDGERGDSYRRMMRWHSMHVLVADVTRDSMVEALRVGRAYLAFEALGTPVGFDFVAEGPAGIVEMGGDAPIGATLRVVRPSLPDGFPSSPPPTLSLRILRAAPGGAVEVARGEGATLEHLIAAPGAYRAEVRIVPEHARPYLGALADELVREMAWIYSGVIYVAE